MVCRYTRCDGVAARPWTRGGAGGALRRARRRVCAARPIRSTQGGARDRPGCGRGDRAADPHRAVEAPRA